MGTDRESDIETALAAAVANAALEGIVIEPDEQDLIRMRQSGELSQAQFLDAALQLAQRKSGTSRP